MAHSKSPHKNLRYLFETSITVNHIAEKLIICYAEDDIETARKMMDEKHFDCLVVEEDGKMIGYIERDDLSLGNIKNSTKPFMINGIVSESTPLMKAIFLLENQKRLFVLEENQITKIVTTADLQKPPVSLLLYGLVSLVELYLVKLIKQEFPDHGWMKLINRERLRKAKDIFDARRLRNEEIELIDCIQLCDKRDIIRRTDTLYKIFEFESKNKFLQYFNQLENLRDYIAHAQEYMNLFTKNSIIDIVKQTERILVLCENALAQ